MIPKLYIGPVSQSAVKAAIELSQQKIKLGLIPSRRQVDFNGGYIGWDTKEFSDLIKSQSDIILERDHGGAFQGQEPDNGIQSFLEDQKYFDIIHLDPFKYYSSIKEAAHNTALHIKYLSSINQTIKFEIGTEEGIRKYSPDEFKLFIEKVYSEINQNEIDRILYFVVQGGTKVREGINKGSPNNALLKEFINICKKFNKLSKEHNGDYLTTEEIKEKFNLGLSSINIAPEFGTLESEIYIQEFNHKDRRAFFELILNSKKWVKWFDASFKPEENKEKLIHMCGHYVFEYPEFKKIKSKYPQEINNKVIEKLKARILEIVL